MEPIVSHIWHTNCTLSVLLYRDLPCEFGASTAIAGQESDTLGRKELINEVRYYESFLSARKCKKMIALKM